MSTKTTSLRAKLALTVGGTLVALLASECGARILEAPRVPNPRVDPMFMPFVDYHPVLGWDGRPNVKREGPDHTTVEQNSRGDRDVEYETVAAPNTLRVLALGDSFTWGYSVEVEHRFTERLARQCGEGCLPPGSELEVINYGVSGYGTTQEFLKYVIRGVDLKPDVLLVAFFAGNDMGDNVARGGFVGPRPRIRPCDSDPEELCVERVPVPPRVAWPEHRLINLRGTLAPLAQSSALVRWIGRRGLPHSYLRWRAQRQLEPHRPRIPFEVTAFNPDYGNREEATRAVLNELFRTARGNDTEPLVFLFTSAFPYTDGEHTEHLARTLVLDVSRDADVEVVDFWNRTEGLDYREIFYDLESHWKPRGHAMAARAIAPALGRVLKKRTQGRNAPP